MEGEKWREREREGEREGHNGKVREGERRREREGRRERRRRKCLFNDALNTFYIRLYYGVRHMVKEHSESERGNPLPPHWLLTLSDLQQGFFYMQYPTARIIHTTAFVTPVVEHTYIHTYIHTLGCLEWLAWLAGNRGRIGAIGSSPSNGLKPNLLGQKGLNPLCQGVYVYVCIVNADIQTIHRCSHTSIHTHIYTYIHTHIHTYIHTHIHTYSARAFMSMYV